MLHLALLNFLSPRLTKTDQRIIIPREHNMNSTHKITGRQQNKIKNAKIKASSAYSVINEHDLIAQVAAFPPSRQKALNQIVFTENYYPEKNSKAQLTMARAAGIDETTCNKSIRDIREKGLLAYEYSFKKSNIYFLNPLFKKQSVINALWNILPAIRAFTLSLLVLSQNPFKMGNAGLNKYQGITKLSIQEKKDKVVVTFQGGSTRMSLTGPPETVKRMLIMKAVHPYLTTLCKSLPLTTVGICKLMAFDEQTIIKAMDKVKKISEVKKPYSLLFKLCLQGYKEERKAPNWNLVAKMCDILQADPKGPCVEFEGYREGHVPQNISTKGKDEHPVLFDTSVMMRDLSHEDPWQSACLFYDNLLTDSLDLDPVVTAVQKQRVTGGINPHWDRLSPDQQESLRTTYPQFCSVIHSKGNESFLSTLVHASQARESRSSFDDGSPLIEPPMDEEEYA